jgi:hypothetical protein
METVILNLIIYFFSLQKEYTQTPIHRDSECLLLEVTHFSSDPIGKREEY